MCGAHLRVVHMEIRPLWTLRTLHLYDERMSPIWSLLSSSRGRSREHQRRVAFQSTWRRLRSLLLARQPPPSSTMAGAKSIEKNVKCSGENEPSTVLADTEDVYEDNALDPVYQAKAKILNDAFQEIGMGKYQVRILTATNVYVLRRAFQWYLFIVAGFGWLSYVLHFFGPAQMQDFYSADVFSSDRDNLWPVSATYNASN